MYELRYCFIFSLDTGYWIHWDEKLIPIKVAKRMFMFIEVLKFNGTCETCVVPWTIYHLSTTHTHIYRQYEFIPTIDPDEWTQWNILFMHSNQNCNGQMAIGYNLLTSLFFIVYILTWPIRYIMQCLHWMINDWNKYQHSLWWIENKCSISMKCWTLNMNSFGACTMYPSMNYCIK